MTKLLVILAATTFLFSSCQDHTTKREKDQDNDHGNQHCVTIHPYKHHGLMDADSTASNMPIDSCNKMIFSYLQSVGYPQQQNDSNLYSLIYSADTLKAFLNANPSVTKLKFMLAHTLDYINNGGQGQGCRHQIGALTLVIAGYDAKGNYVFYYSPRTQAAMAMDHFSPCPYCCPTQGTAMSDTLVLTSTERK